MEYLKRMLEFSIMYEECDITHTISCNKNKLIIVRYSKDDRLFKITYLPTLSIVYFQDIYSTLDTINKTLNHYADATC
ncbi:hypothetical protein [Heyndrickxia acidicola]|uniref:Uncharacterized protein n=1 Tax=Heyndrickxia acidicola TaxID=209389 RepID=A0ABU6MMN8_9BACI|nr:hypothetical protein [Heyndrickxia acidicola]MED1205764.1 hypothetical protein [Heyndrickxia acidicola]